MSIKMNKKCISKSKTISIFDNFVPVIKPKTIELLPSPLILRVTPIDELAERDFVLSEKETNEKLDSIPRKKSRKSILHVLIRKGKIPS